VTAEAFSATYDWGIPDAARTVQRSVSLGTTFVGKNSGDSGILQFTN